MAASFLNGYGRGLTFETAMRRLEKRESHLVPARKQPLHCHCAAINVNASNYVAVPLLASGLESAGWGMGGIYVSHNL
jgi:hypothetical protein